VLLLTSTDTERKALHLSDWGDGSKTDRVQAFAAKAAVSLVEHVLNN
jgi:hypothetical protein